MQICRGRAFQAEGTASAKVLGSILLLSPFQGKVEVPGSQLILPKITQQVTSRLRFKLAPFATILVFPTN